MSGHFSGYKCSLAESACMRVCRAVAIRHSLPRLTHSGRTSQPSYDLERWHRLDSLFSRFATLIKLTPGISAAAETGMVL
jgi:hypothetical protein